LKSEPSLWTTDPAGSGSDEDYKVSSPEGIASPGTASPASNSPTSSPAPSRRSSWTLSEIPLSESPNSKTIRYSKPRIIFAAVPYKYHSELSQAQLNVSKYFHQCNYAANSGIFQVGDKRYVLVRAASISSELKSTGKMEDEIMAGMLYDLGYHCGKHEAQKFKSENFTTVNVLESFVFLTFAGWSFSSVKNLNIKLDETFSLQFENHTNFEAARSKDGPCAINAGFYAGWCSTVTGLPLECAEVNCCSQSSARCTFLVAHTNAIYLNASKNFKKPTFFEFGKYANTRIAMYKDLKTEQAKKFKKAKDKAFVNTQAAEDAELSESVYNSQLSAFTDMKFDPMNSRIKFANERYIVFPINGLAKSIATSKSFLNDKDLISGYTNHNLFKFFRNVGNADAAYYCQKELDVPKNDRTVPASTVDVMRLEGVLSHTGWGEMRFPQELLGPSNFDKQNPVILFEVKGSCECSQALAKEEQNNEPVCICLAGYISGWMSQVFNQPIVASEIRCASAGHSSCHFVASNADTIRSYTKYFLKQQEMDKAKITTILNRLTNYL